MTRRTHAQIAEQARRAERADVLAWMAKMETANAARAIGGCEASRLAEQRIVALRGAIEACFHVGEASA